MADLARLLVALLLALVTAGPVLAVDTDGDGFSDAVDNCVLSPNPTQLDADGDGFGQICDADFDQDGVVGGPDLAMLREYFGQTVPPAPLVLDVAEDGMITIVDRNHWVGAFGGPPGPAAAPVIPALPLLGSLAAAAALAGLARRRLRRTMVAGLATALLLGAPAAEAGGALSFVWTATTGTGTPGGSFIDAQPGDQLTGEIRVQPDAGGVAFVAVSLRFDADLDDELDLVDVSTPALQFVDGAVVTPVGDPPLATTESTTSQAGEVRTCVQDAFSALQPPFATEFLVCSITFEVTGDAATDGADLELGFFNTGVDSLNDDANNVLTTLPAPVEAGVDTP